MIEDNIAYDGPFIDNLILEKKIAFSSIEIKIGINYGTTLIQLAESNPSTFYIGIEFKEENSSIAINKIIEKGIENVIIINGEALAIMDSLKTRESISQIHLYFPTTAPRSIGLSSRLVNEKFINIVHSLLSQNGTFRMVTDDHDYYFGVLDLLKPNQWQAIDWVELNLPKERSHLVGTYCEKQFRAAGKDIYSLQVIKWKE